MAVLKRIVLYLFSPETVFKHGTEPCCMCRGCKAKALQMRLEDDLFIKMTEIALLRDTQQGASDTVLLPA